MEQPSEARRRIMRAIKGRDTAPERMVRSIAHRMGFRFRVCRNDLPGNPDIVFAKLKKLIFIHGCFWHGHDCGQGVRIPSKNTAYWRQKITRNAERDEKVQASLAALGWEVAVLWECELKDESALVTRLRQFLDGPADKQHRKSPP